MNRQQEKAMFVKIKNLRFKPVSNSTWNTIRIEGLDQEQNKLKRKAWRESKYHITDNDVIGLKKYQREQVEKFNQFDINLKTKFDNKYVDLIDYDNGEIKIVTSI